MRPPIVARSDVTDVFESVDVAERYLEAPDIRDGGIKISDRDGRPVRASIAKRWLADVVKLHDEEGAEPKLEELRASLLTLM